MATPADLFGEIWRRLETVLAQVNFDPDPTYEALLEGAEQALAGDGSGWPVLKKRIEEAKESGSTSTYIAQLVACGQAIDNWYMPLSNGFATLNELDAPLALAKQRYTFESRLNENPEPGSVVLRRPWWGLWADIKEGEPDADSAEFSEPRDFFSTLIFIPKHIAAEDIDLGQQDTKRPIEIRFRVIAAAHNRLQGEDRKWRVGFAPIAEIEDEIKIEVATLHGRPAYDAVVRQLDSRVSKVIQYLCQEGCQIIALPEMTIHPRSLEAVRKAIVQFGPTSDLALVLAGTHRRSNGKSKPPANEAVLLDHRGEEIMRQRKLHRWNIDAKRCNQLGLPAPTTDTHRYEFIEPGTVVNVVEVFGLGRLAVMICEDHGRGEPGRWIRKHLLLDLQLVPVMDTHLEPRRWAAIEAKRACETGHTRIIVANSLSLTLRQNRTITDMGDKHNMRYFAVRAALRCAPISKMGRCAGASGRFPHQEQRKEHLSWTGSRRPGRACEIS